MMNPLTLPPNGLCGHYVPSPAPLPNSQDLEFKSRAGTLPFVFSEDPLLISRVSWRDLGIVLLWNLGAGALGQGLALGFGH